MKDFAIKVKEKGLKNFSFADISREDLDKFCENIQEVQRLAYAYSVSFNRKEIAEQIADKLSPLETFLWIIENELKGVKIACDAYESVNDIELAMNVLLKLANIDNNDYILKKFYATDVFSQEVAHCDKENFSPRGTVWVIGKAGIINSIEDKEYDGCNLAMALTNIVGKGCELIVCTDHFYPNNVLPYGYSAQLEMFQFNTIGPVSAIKCYTQISALRDAVTMFRSYISKNSGDISGLKEDRLYEFIKTI